LYFESDDFRADVRFYAAGSHPALKCLVRFECGRDSAMRANDRADGLPWEFGPGVDQGDDVCLLALYVAMPFISGICTRDPENCP
jgi:hypothetical protein